MKKICSICKKSFLGIFIVIYGIAFLIDLFFEGWEYCCKKSVLIPNLFFVIIIIGLLILGKKIYIKREVIESKLQKSDRWILIFTGVLFVIQVLITYCIIFRTSWDAGIVTAQARLVAQKSSEVWAEYYSSHPNNLFITFIYSFFYWIAGIFGNDSFGVILIAIVQCLMSSIAAMLVYKIMRKICKGRILPVSSWCVFALWIGMSPWKIIPYSDSFGLFFPIVILWLYQLLQNNRFVIVKCMLIGAITILGFKIKPTVMILLIAIVIIELIKLLEKEKRKEAVLRIGVLCLSAIVTIIAYGCFDMAGYMKIEINEEAACGPTHFLMLGLREDTNGVYSSGDEEFSKSFDTKEERSKANIEEVKRRIQEFGFSGLVRHGVKNSLTNFNDGTFTWGWDGDFYAGIIDEPEPILSPILRSFYYDDGKFNFLFVAIMQFWWIFILFGMILNVFDLINKREIADIKSVIMLALIGMAIFVMIFEGRARYLYLYSPIYVIISFFGFQAFFVSGETNKNGN